MGFLRWSGACLLVGACAGGPGAPRSTARVEAADAGTDPTTAEVGGCAPGSLAAADGTCTAAGVAPSACAPGFVADGDGGCGAVLPADPCPSGTFARLGETTCHDVAPCGDDAFPPVGDGAAVQFVDAAAVASGADGTRAHPWSTVGAGVAHAAAGGTVAIAAGSYVEAITVDKPLSLVGRCPRLVTLVTPPAADANTGPALSAAGVDGLVLRTLALQSDMLALSAAVDVAAGSLSVANVWFRDGQAVHTTHAHVDVSDSLFESHVTALSLETTGGSIRSSTLRGVPAESLPPTPLDAIDPGTEPLVLASLVVESMATGVFASGATVHVDAVLFRDVGDNAVDLVGAPTDVARSTFSRITGNAISVGSGVLTVDASTFRDVGHEAIYGGGLGDGAMTIRGSSVARASGCGIVSEDFLTTLERVDVSDMHVDADYPASVGICLYRTSGHEATDSVVRGSVVRGASAGLIVQWTRASASGLRIEDMRQNAVGAYGDAVDVVGSAELAGSLALDASAILRTARAGLGVFGAKATLATTTFDDCAIDLDGEPNGGLPFALTDLGGNVCSDAAASGCAVASAELQPPSPVAVH